LIFAGVEDRFALLLARVTVTGGMEVEGVAFGSGSSAARKEVVVNAQVEVNIEAVSRGWGD
jgi:hypothetical protein